MNLHKILKIVSAVLSLLGIIFLIRIVSAGDDVVKADAALGDTAIVDPMVYIAYIIFAITVGFVLFFVLKNLFTNKETLKSALIGVGLFVAILAVAYAVSGGDTMAYLYDDAQVTERESRMVGAGLVAFYILILTAAGATLLSGVKKIMNK